MCQPIADLKKIKSALPLTKYHADRHGGPRADDDVVRRSCSVRNFRERGECVYSPVLPFFSDGSKSTKRLATRLARPVS